MSYFVHPTGICESSEIGEGTRIWAFAHVLTGAKIGRDCNICDHVFIEHDVVVGDRVTIKSGVQLWDGLRIGDDVFIGPNATFSNDKFPRSKAYQTVIPQTEIAEGATVGANSTILPGIKIGRLAMVGAASVITKDVPPNAIVTGNPGRIVGYADSLKKASSRSTSGRPSAGERPSVATLVSGVVLHELKLVEDLRGNLVVGEFESQIQFVPKRYFIVFEVPSTDIRGEHAHRSCRQFLVCVKGCVSVLVDDGKRREEIVLDRPNVGLYLPAMVWNVHYKYSADAVLLVFASELYDSADYIRDYEDFLRLVETRRS